MILSFIGNCIEGSVQLTGGDDQDEGRIEVCYNGEWGNVCDTTFGLFDGQVVCGQVLGVKMSKLYQKWYIAL